MVNIQTYAHVPLSLSLWDGPMCIFSGAIARAPGSCALDHHLSDWNSSPNGRNGGALLMIWRVMKVGGAAIRDLWIGISPLKLFSISLECFGVRVSAGHLKLGRALGSALNLSNTIRAAHILGHDGEKDDEHYTNDLVFLSVKLLNFFFFFSKRRRAINHTTWPLRHVDKWSAKFYALKLSLSTSLSAQVFSASS